MKKYFLWISITALSAGVLAIISLITSLPDGKLHVSMLDIGQGDAILIESPEGKRILVDGGPDNSVLQRLGEQLPFFENTIDLMIISHPHADHINGLVEVLKRYDVKKVLLTGIAYPNATYDEFLKTIQEKNIPFEFPIASEDYLIEPDLTLDILYPTKKIFGETFDNANNSSIVAKLNFGETSLMLTGDAEKEEEAEILKQPFDVNAKLLKTGHHGSKTSSSPPWIAAVNPDNALISAGKDNQFKHPHEETMKLFANKNIQTFVTKDLGTIEFVSDGKAWKQPLDL